MSILRDGTLEKPRAKIGLRKTANYWLLAETANRRMSVEDVLNASGARWDLVQANQGFNEFWLTAAGFAAER